MQGMISSLAFFFIKVQRREGFGGTKIGGSKVNCFAIFLFQNSELLNP